MDRVELAFRKFDLNQDGYLTRDEFDLVSWPETLSTPPHSPLRLFRFFCNKVRGEEIVKMREILSLGPLGFMYDSGPTAEWDNHEQAFKVTEERKSTLGKKG